LPSFDQRHEEQGEPECRDRDAAHVERRRIRRARLVQRAVREHERDAPDGEVDQEQRAPAQVERVPLDQVSAEQLPGDRREPDGEAEVRERARSLVLGERHLDQRQHLRERERRGEALEQARREEEPRARREPAQERRDHEPAQPDEEHALAAVRVAQPPARHDEHGVRQPVERDDELLLRERRAEPRVDLRQREVDDEEVDHAQERRRQRGGERQPAPRIGLAPRRAARTRIDGLGHAVRAAGSPVMGSSPPGVKGT
jgi:hypothetical protein